MKRFLKWFLAVAVALVVLAIAALALIPSLVDTPRIQGFIASSASQALGRPVRFASASVRVFPLPSIELRKLEVGEDPSFGSTPFLTLESGELRLRVRPLLTGRVEFGDLVLKKPLIALIQHPDGRLNVASLGTSRESAPRARHGGGGGGATAGAALASRVKIEDGLVTYVAQGAGGALTRYRVEGLDLALTGSGPSVGFEGGARVRPGGVAVRVASGKIALNGARTLLDAPLSARVTVDGKDVSELVTAVAGPSPSIAGAVKASLVVAGTLGAPKASGDVELDGVKVTQTNLGCPEPKRRTLSLAPIKLNVTWEDGRLMGRPLTTGLDKGTVRANLAASVERGARVQLNDLAVKALPLEQVLVDFLCQGYAVSGPLDLTGALSLEPAEIWRTLSGRGELRVGPGKVVGSQALALFGDVVHLGGAVSSLLRADLPMALFSSPLDFDSITGTYQITSGVVTTRDLLYSSRQMKIAVAGEYGLATGRMDLDMVVHHGRGQIKAKVTGTAASPSIRVSPTTILRDVDPAKLERRLQDLLKQFR